MKKTIVIMTGLILAATAFSAQARQRSHPTPTQTDAYNTACTNNPDQCSNLNQQRAQAQSQASAKAADAKLTAQGKRATWSGSSNNQ